MKLNKYIFYETPEHGYLRVKTSELKKMNILDKITECSPRNKSNIYLEEDVDFGTFVNEYKNFYKVDLNFEQQVEHVELNDNNNIERHSND